MKKFKILAIVGSLRKDSYNLQLALTAKKLLNERADFTILEYQDISFFNQDTEYPTPVAVARVRQEVSLADGIWFFSPEYNHYFSGVLKNLLDWLSRRDVNNNPSVLIHKPAAVSGISPGMSGSAIAQDHLISLISFLNMDVMNSPRLLIPHALQQIDEDGKLALQASLPFLEKQVDAFLNFIAKRV